jgi:hypothetical protein
MGAVPVCRTVTFVGLGADCWGMHRLGTLLGRSNRGGVAIPHSPHVPMPLADALPRPARVDGAVRSEEVVVSGRCSRVDHHLGRAEHGGLNWGRALVLVEPRGHRHGDRGW